VPDPSPQANAHPDPARAARLRLLALASLPDLEALIERLPAKPGYVHVRRPETGLALVRARAGGVGQRFNLGEATMTRCTVRLDNGRIGHGHVLGRSARHAELIAVLDAVLQDVGSTDLLAPLAVGQDGRRRKAAEKSAATKVEFFTVARQS
jgi:alpha-D-ribose 1-methylphosphonate 5-triphosphate synthase subunit PhnG